jgi:DNA-binding response OmpR family regulator
MNILLVEDNATYGQLVADNLRRSGFDCAQATTVKQAKAAIAAVSFAAILLDLGLPDHDGIALLKDLRRDGNTTPILIVTARNSLHDRVNGLRIGADDYLAKPFSLDELVARLHALLRRPSGLLGRSLCAGNVVLDVGNRQLTVAGDAQAVWRAREMSVLELLIRHQSQVVTRRLLEAQLFGIAGEQESNTVDVYVHRLRVQLTEAGATVKIDTIRGVGFILSEKAKTQTEA